jgi:glucokinase
MLVLAGDIGGTKTNLAIFSREKGLHDPIAENTFVSANYPDLETMAKEFLAKTELRVDRAAFGVAGPVIAGAARITNLPWVMEEEKLRAALSIESVKLLNDLESIANAVPSLEAGDVSALNEIPPAPQGPIGVIAPGTGLGVAFLVWTKDGYTAYPSEGGHVDFAPGNELETDLLHYLQRKFGRASYERVISGIGIPNIYAFLRDGFYVPESLWVAEQIAGAHDPTPVIVTNAMTETPDPLCAKVMEIFSSVLAAKAGNLGLVVMATGGVYLGGGIPPRILPLLQRDAFMSTFRYKGRLSSLMEQIPVRVILNTKSGLLGAARVAIG